jgi:heme/copper-type cytochrome/quinol oxidase subunit 2
MHGTIIVFLGVVPLAVGAFGIRAIDSFGRPRCASELDATPGIVQPVWFTPVEIGEWDMACSQLCGLGHYRMRGVDAIQPHADFDAWVAREAARLQQLKRSAIGSQRSRLAGLKAAKAGSRELRRALEGGADLARRLTIHRH